MVDYLTNPRNFETISAVNFNNQTNCELVRDDDVNVFDDR